MKLSVIVIDGRFYVGHGNTVAAGPFPTRSQAAKAIAPIRDQQRQARSVLATARAKRRAKPDAAAARIADHVDGYDRDDLGESPDY